MTLYQLNSLHLFLRLGVHPGVQNSSDVIQKLSLLRPLLFKILANEEASSSSGIQSDSTGHYLKAVPVYQRKTVFAEQE